MPSRLLGPTDMILFLLAKVGQNHICKWCITVILAGQIAKYTVIYGVNIRFWPTLLPLQNPVKATVAGVDMHCNQEAEMW